MLVNEGGVNLMSENFLLFCQAVINKEIKKKIKSKSKKLWLEEQVNSFVKIVDTNSSPQTLSSWIQRCRHLNVVRRAITCELDRHSSWD